MVAALVEGNSINSTVRMTGISKPTILKLVAELGRACRDHHDSAVRNVPAKRVQCDEIWSFCYAKAKNVPVEKRVGFGCGDIWTWTAIDADSKLMLSYMVTSDRQMGSALDFMRDLAARVANRLQVTTDGHQPYAIAVGEAFGWNVDHTMLRKIYGPDRSGPARYSPPICIGVTSRPICGHADPVHVSTSFVERANLTMRMGMRRFTRLTNGFSKKIENHIAMISIFFAYYNFAAFMPQRRRRQRTRRV